MKLAEQEIEKVKMRIEKCKMSTVQFAFFIFQSAKTPLPVHDKTVPNATARDLSTLRPSVLRRKRPARHLRVLLAVSVGGT